MIDTADRRVVMPAAEARAVADHLCGLFAADQVLYRVGLTLRALAGKPEIAITLPGDVIARAVNSFDNEPASIRRLAKYFQEAK